MIHHPKMEADHPKHRLEVRRVLFYPTMKYAFLYPAEGPNLPVLWVIRLHLWMVDHPFKLPSSRYCAFVIAWNWLTECVNAFISSLIEESKGVP
jgi:hypothetical protein